VTINLFEASSRILPTLSNWASQQAIDRLNQVGVRVFLNSAINREDAEEIYLPQSQLKTKTVVWTAGISVPQLIIGSGLRLSSKNKLIVNEYLQSPTDPEIYGIGDLADTTYSGMAQTALRDGEFVARDIQRRIQRKILFTYQAMAPAYSIPVGGSWAITQTKRLRLVGELGWWYRRLIDWRFFNSILPAVAAWRAFLDGKRIFETCPKCSTEK
jgi:NADH dehydrogenase